MIRSAGADICEICGILAESFAGEGWIAIRIGLAKIVGAAENRNIMIVGIISNSGELSEERGFGICDGHGEC